MLPKDPQNLLAPPRGQCRATPPSSTLILIGHPGSGQFQNMSIYPDLPHNFAACGMYAERPAAELVDLTPVQALPAGEAT